MASSATDKDARTRKLLEDLIHPIAGDTANILSDKLLSRFGTLSEAMSAGLTLRGDIPADEAEIIAFLHNVRRCMLELLALEFDDAPILTSLGAVVDYLRLAIAHERTEQLRALFLRSDGRLIVDEILSRGGARRTAALPSQIIRRALELGSSSLLLAHNHPSGDHSPSAADIATTRQIADLARQLDVELYDHLIISKTGWTSLRAEGLL